MALMETEGIDLTFTDDAIRRSPTSRTTVNERTENIGAAPPAHRAREAAG
jgi:ATP-dependent HslUV protease ATP-binding subunit HslU